MPICIECRYPVHQLYTTYSKADDRALGRGVRLTICPRCKKFADKYVEHDFVVLFIDLVLIKPQVYRHLLFNRLGRDDDGFDPSIIRLGILLLLFDVYLTWARIEKESSDPSASSTTSSFSPLAWLLMLTAAADDSPTSPRRNSSSATSTSILTYPIPIQYAFFLALCALETLAFHLPIRLLSTRFPKRTAISPQQSTAAATAPHPNRISTALFVSSCSKLFPILMVIWDYDLPSSAGAVSWAVILNNVAALEIALGCGWVRAAVLGGVGALARGLVGGVVLRWAGLGDGGGVSGGQDVGGVVGMGREMGRWVGLV